MELTFDNIDFEKHDDQSKDTLCHCCNDIVLPGTGRAKYLFCKYHLDKQQKPVEIHLRLQI